MAMAGISPWSRLVEDLEIWIVFRTYPIRIAGNSGPMHKETTWDELNTRSQGRVQPEYTTVTKKERRVGEWDRALAVAAITANGAPSKNVHIALTFLDYLVPSVSDSTTLNQEAEQTLVTFENLLGQRIELVGTGPQTVVDRRK